MNNTDLRFLYWDYNRRYFKGKLPRIKVRFKRLPCNALGLTEMESGGRKKDKIYISPALKRWPCVVQSTLLHEMVHISLPRRIYHGKEFQRAMLKLAKKGAFKGKW